MPPFPTTKRAKVESKSLSEYPGSAEGDQGTGDMEEGDIVLRLLLPAHQKTTKAVQPAVAALDDPTIILLYRQMLPFGL
jgi:hypothetical protein